MRNDKVTLSFLWKSMGKHKYKIVFLAFFRTMVSVSMVLVSLCVRLLIDSALEGNDQSFFVSISLLFTIYLVQQISKSGSILVTESCRADIENNIKERTVRLIYGKSYETVSQKHSEEWMSLLTSDAAIVSNSLTTFVPEVLAIIFRLSSIIVIMCETIPELIWFLVPAGITIMLISFVLKRQMKARSNEVQRADQWVRVDLAEKLRNLMVIHAFSKEEACLNENKQFMKIHQERRMDRARYSAKMSLFFGLVLRSASFLGALIGGLHLLHGTITYGSFYVVLQMISLVRAPASEISDLVTEFYSMLSSVDRLMEIDTYQDEMINIKSEREMLEYYNRSFKGILAHKISFSYKSTKSYDEEQMVIKDLSFSIAKGEFVGVTGESGVGKTTFTKLLLCLYQPNNGSIIVKDDEESGDKKLDASFRNLFAYVPQGNGLMSGSIRNVVSFGEPEANDERIWNVLDIAGIRSVIEALPNHLDTVVGEQGSNFSEGQKQRLAIARALYTQRPFLLLDEATSSLDESTEKIVLSNLKTMTDRTVVIITHRESVLNVCDHFIVFQKDGTATERLTRSSANHS